MEKLKARVVGGQLVLDAPCDLPEGTVVDLVVVDEGDELDDAERAELHAALDAAWQSLRAGESGVPASDVIAALRKRG